ncbi:NAD(P)-dependent iron-only hydrogenase catalytic subunit [Caldicellulosiruptor bescii]|uniref:Hydrogenase, Fe-only n=2 Tax=Caldicellulosiruptor bescii TaxID=31899 RepID=B9MRU5_CALBD|nr:NADH-dependent [FeFe] hydrogenase, group A6 [Caldicellulosiruptor bescii]ACM60399.1 hydrogenase, Fe-only [Caldicellulosiruptor bescii DSM 6725]PBC87813.1 NAD(P)-dependent iron-only hydrogenase catalytic subunit [Caldicellulosiruptor bescii]PBC90745.1 NAD(P)-dependent iron-only hydrogenase catalytic subunit [Caldicellulosiruptor bescii]PBD03822.1 NAD(P)-dependent iron-only hydrogenase catalytic subunit [Caldicellulosiruptor bescii]PBD06543.1 NAD(P)-dependent iron-only hydrogenase catalytic s
MEMVNITIDGKKIQVPKDYTVLQAAREAGVEIPTLCYLKGINEIGACRMCVVEVKGARSLQAACVYPVSEGMEVITNSERVRRARKVNLELILSNHDRSCLTCVRSGNCELQKLAEDLNVKQIRYEGENIRRPLDDFSPSVVRDPNKCILCKRCINVCRNVQEVGVINANYRGFRTVISTAFDRSLNDVACTMCGQCIQACPVGALREKDSTDIVWKALADKNKYVVVQAAPAVRVALGEEFGLPIGTRVTGKMVTALKMLGFDKVFDTDTGADLTIMEEGTELINRIKNGGKLPLITSCSPGWIKFCEHYFPEFLDNLSTCKSPHEMFGAILKTYFAQKMGIDPANMFVVSVMPCTAKKFEAQREELAASGYPDVDAVLTTRELARMIKEAGIDFVNLPDSHFDDPMGDATGAGVIFGTTGGVMEAALRTVYEVLTGKTLENVEITQVRGLEGIREAEIDVGTMKIKAAVAHGLANAKKLLEMVKNGEKEYHFIEIMACPGGCIMGGGQPIVPAKVKEKVDVAKLRASAIYDEDRSLPIRKSHENPAVKRLYEEFLDHPNSEKAHHILHTHYKKRPLY